MKGVTGYAVNGVACLYIMAFIVIFCFPFSLPVTAVSMNYACLITGGLSMFVTAFWFWRRKDYVGPTAIEIEVVAKDAI